MNTAPTGRSDSDVYYDPYDVEIDRDPYPTYQRLRDEAPIYYNESHDFYAVSRHVDVAKGVADRDTFISNRGNVLEFIKSGIERLVILSDKEITDADVKIYAVPRG